MNTNSKPEVLGVDFGGVVTDRMNDGTDTSFLSDNYLVTTAMPGAIEALRRLVEDRFGPNVYFVSKCGPTVERKTREWLAHHDVFTRTGIPADNIRFCRRREDKAPICAGLGVSHFIDDRASVLRHLESVPHLYLFRPDARESALAERIGLPAARMASWEEVLTRLLG